MNESVTPLLLIYNPDEKKKTPLSELCARKGITLRIVQPGHWLEPIGALAGIPGMMPTGLLYEGPVFSDEMLLFNGFDNQMLGDFLTEYRKAGIEKINLKATITPYNLSWNSLQLRDELNREHEELAGNK